MTDTPTPSPSFLPDLDPVPSYEQAIRELESLVARLDAGQMPLDDLLQQYRRAQALLAHCRQQLDAVQAQIQVLDQGGLRPWVEGV